MPNLLLFDAESVVPDGWKNRCVSSKSDIKPGISLVLLNGSAHRFPRRKPSKSLTYITADYLMQSMARVSFLNLLPPARVDERF